MSGSVSGERVRSVGIMRVECKGAIRIVSIFQPGPTHGAHLAIVGDAVAGEGGARLRRAKFMEF